MHWVLAHLVGDFLLQNDWMTSRKKESAWVSLVHVFFYSLPFIFVPFSLGQILLVAIQHFIQDRTEVVPWLMKVLGRKEFMKEPFAPWSLILVDNILHILWIAWVASL